jgi:hypothetical protein
MNLQRRPKEKITHETTVLNWSILGACGIDLRGYLGSLASLRVLGRWKDTECRVLRLDVEWAPWRAAFLAALALLSLADAAPAKLG